MLDGFVPITYFAPNIHHTIVADEREQKGLTDLQIHDSIYSRNLKISRSAAHERDLLETPQLLRRNLENAPSPAILAFAPCALVLADARSLAFLALAPNALVLADA